MEIQLKDGRRDLIMAVDSSQPRPLAQGDWAARLDGELAFIRGAANGEVQRVSLCRGQSLRVGKVVVRPQGNTDLTEWP